MQQCSVCRYNRCVWCGGCRCTPRWHSTVCSSGLPCAAVPGKAVAYHGVHGARSSYNMHPTATCQGQPTVPHLAVGAVVGLCHLAAMHGQAGLCQGCGAAGGCYKHSTGYNPVRYSMGQVVR